MRCCRGNACDTRKAGARRRRARRRTGREVRAATTSASVGEWRRCRSAGAALHPLNAEMSALGRRHRLAHRWQVEGDRQRITARRRRATDPLADRWWLRVRVPLRVTPISSPKRWLLPPPVTVAELSSSTARGRTGCAPARAARTTVTGTSLPGHLLRGVGGVGPVGARPAHRPVAASRPGRGRSCPPVAPPAHDATTG